MATARFIAAPDGSGSFGTPEEMKSTLEALKGVVKTVEVDPGIPVLPAVVVLTDGEGLGSGPVVGGTQTDGYKLSHPDLKNLTTKKLHHATMVMETCCTNCACCGQPLSDSLSAEVGMGPHCRKKGFSQEPLPADPIDAMILLSEWPELVGFLNKHYSAEGNRGLVNGLVRVASLNRPRGGEQKEGDERLFKACCDAVEALGYPKMANLLRDTLVVAWLTKSDVPGEDGISYLRTKAYRTPGWLWSEITRKAGGASWDKKTRKFRVPMHESGSPAILCSSKDSGKSNKRVVWETLLKAFEGCAVKIDGHAVPIRVKSSV